MTAPLLLEVALPVPMPESSQNIRISQSPNFLIHESTNNRFSLSEWSGQMVDRGNTSPPATSRKISLWLVDSCIRLFVYSGSGKFPGLRVNEFPNYNPRVETRGYNTGAPLA